VGAGIFLSRLTGFARDVAIAGFFGTSLAADAYTAALRIPNIVRNLLGEGTLSASFIPVYSGLLARDEKSDARRLAGAVLGLLLALAAALSGLGVLLAPWLTRLIAPGWSAEALDLTKRAGSPWSSPLPGPPSPAPRFSSWSSCPPPGAWPARSGCRLASPGIRFVPSPRTSLP
jgi:hypothetical protein